MTTPSRRPLQGFGQQLGRLQRLAQPYFLPVEESRSWQFLLLVVALLVVVVGVTLLLLTAAVQISGVLIPSLQERFLPGIPERVDAIWSGWIGPLVSGLTWWVAVALWPFAASFVRGAGCLGCCWVSLLC